MLTTLAIVGAWILVDSDRVDFRAVMGSILIAAALSVYVWGPA